MSALLTSCHNIAVMQVNVFVVRGREAELVAMAFCCPMDSYRKVCWRPVSVRYKNWRGEIVDSWYKPYKNCSIADDAWKTLGESGPYYGEHGFGYYLDVLPEGVWKAHPGNRSRSAEIVPVVPEFQLTEAPPKKEEEPPHPGLASKVPSHGYERIDKLAGNAYVKDEEDVPF